MNSAAVRYLAILLLACAVIAAPMERAFSTPTPKPTPRAKATPLTKAQKAKAEQFKRSAPADEYFGKMKLSYLGIDNTFRDQAIRAGEHTTDDSVISRVRSAEDALGAWRRKYPRDPQLPRSIFLASRVDLKIWLADFQQRAAHYMIELRDKFSGTFFGKQTKAELKKGLTMNVYAPAQLCSGVPVARSTTSPAPLATLVAPGASPTNSPAPLATLVVPGASPTNYPAPLATDDPKNNIKVNVIPVPCFVPTPVPPMPALSPKPSLSPISSPIPKPSLSPRPSLSPAPSLSPRPSLSPAPSLSPRPSLSPTPALSPTPLPSPSPALTPTPIRGAGMPS